MAKSKKKEDEFIEEVEITDDIVTDDTAEDEVVYKDPEDTPTTVLPNNEEPAPEKVVGEEIPPIPEGMCQDAANAMAGALGSMMGGGGSEYKDVFDSQTKLFEAISHNNELALKQIDELRSSLTATKLYTKFLTKAIVVTDVVLVLAIILILIFK